MIFLKGNQAYQFEVNVQLDKQNNTISYGKVSNGWPKLISTVFPRIPNDIDSAFAAYCDSVTLFFKGNIYWEWNPITYGNVANGPFAVSGLFPGLCM
jgi:hypothetical protein